ncbi:hypothetical protein EYF80_030233 [Liparis tanakae]|uniref:Uncharacterized protein n=1 Tax=Liparis tanakae TaxID=230148 RepID=A0A4Z2H3B8_9TELE|nr:hypothetical protein EYF80_030233 [Liparis tanakae]
MSTTETEFPQLAHTKSSSTSSFRTGSEPSLTHRPESGSQKSSTPSDLLRPPQTPSDLLRPPQTSSDLLKPPQIPSDPLRPPQTSSDLWPESSREDGFASLVFLDTIRLPFRRPANRKRPACFRHSTGQPSGLLRVSRHCAAVSTLPYASTLQGEEQTSRRDEGPAFDTRGSDECSWLLVFPPPENKPLSGVGVDSFLNR